ncbi:LysM peptidoglycan-binding domain-containing protein [Rhodovulum visakhapatnamense]|nr:LysM peptidoglycan-binding domain-containing protein [Rhodovulum visakhapatnamense]
MSESKRSVWTWAILGGEAVLVLMVAAWFLGRDDDRKADGQAPGAAPSTDAPSRSPDAAAPQAVPATGQAPAGATPLDDRSDLAPPPDTKPPVFDVVRVGPEGGALVAGRAEPGSSVAVLVEGREATRTEVGADGDFAVLFDLDQSRDPRRISLSMRSADGRKTPSEATVILAPSPAPSPASPAVEAEPAAGGAQAVAQAVAQAGAQAADVGAPVPGPAAAEGLSDIGASGAAPAVRPVIEAPHAAPAILISDAGGVRLVAPPQAGEAPPVSGVTLDAITYDADGAVRLAGRGRPGGALRLYLDNAPLAETGIDSAGRWMLHAPEIGAGLHALRADLLAADGSVAARFETPFHREAPAEIAATAAPPAGPGGATGVRVITVQPGYTLWGIADRTYGRGMQYVKIFEANRSQIRDPDLIYPGQIFDLPRGE